MKVERRRAAICLLLVVGTLVVAGSGVGVRPLRAQGQTSRRPAWLAAVYAHVMNAPLPIFATVEESARGIQTNQVDLDATGVEGTYSTTSAAASESNPFFQSLGSNGRTCATCHQAASGMSLSVTAIQNRFRVTGGHDPVFAPVDGANCPDAVRSPLRLKDVHSLLITRGVFRVALPWPPRGITPEFSIRVVSDPTSCEINSVYGLNSANPMISVYRRPLMAANLKFVTTPGIGLSVNNPTTGAPQPVDPYTGEYETGNIMFDGREPTLQSQAFDAILTHSQAKQAPSSDVIQQIVDFENGLFSAQLFDNRAGLLTAYGAFGGPAALASRHPGLIAAPATFGEYSSWANLSSSAERQQQRESVARGQAIFNSRTFTISDVAGFNDVAFIGNHVSGTCASCHNTADAGNDVFIASQRNLGVAGDSAAAFPAPDLPLFKLTCVSGKTTSFNSGTVLTRDPGRALITGKCSDIGKLKAPQLRALPSRAPYFHDGSAKSLSDVVDFYNKRFSIQFSANEKEDLLSFLRTL